MSHFTVMAIGDNYIQNLEKYSENRDVEPYKVHLRPDQVQAMADHYEIDPTRLDLLEEKMSDWSSAPGGVDSDGIYYLSTYNPDSKWDWYVIGGRWEGYFTNKEGCEVDQALKKDIDWEQCDGITFAFLDKAGIWHEKANMGWWAITTNEKADWPDIFKCLLDKVEEDDLVTLLDCHI